MRAAIIGATGGIGRALVDTLATRSPQAEIFALSRTPAAFNAAAVTSLSMDLLDEDSVRQAAETIKDTGPLDLVIIATGILSDGDQLQPEKSYRHHSLETFRRVFEINTFGPGLVAKHFLPIMPRKGRAVFAALSARVGSITDNGYGGWHSYRASKAALNMLIRNYAIEQARRNEDFIAVSLHPGTVDTGLSKPFQSNVPDKQLFTAQTSAEYLLDVIDTLTPEQSGKAFDWAGKEIAP